MWKNFVLNYLIIGIVVFKIVSGVNNSCGPAFKGKCWCGVTEYDRIPQYVVNCTNEGFTDTSVLAHMPIDVQVLIYTGNVLVQLPWNIFGTINEYPKLRLIDMSNNHINEIHGKPLKYFLRSHLSGQNCFFQRKNGQ